MFSRNKFNPEKDLKDLTDKVAFVTGGKFVAILAEFLQLFTRYL